MEAVKLIDKTQLQILKTFANPPPLVQTTLEATCLIFGYPLSWDAAKRHLLSDMHFLNKLLQFDSKQVDPERFVRLHEQYLTREDFTFENITRQSTAASSIFTWLHSTYKAHTILLYVIPKELALKEAKVTLERLNRDIEQKTVQLAEIEAQIEDLSRDLLESQKQEEMFERQIQSTEKQLQRAEKLVSLLSKERSRWEFQFKTLKEKLNNLTGNILLCAAFITYLGPFDKSYRQNIIQEWI